MHHHGGSGIGSGHGTHVVVSSLVASIVDSPPVRTGPSRTDDDSLAWVMRSDGTIFIQPVTALTRDGTASGEESRGNGEDISIDVFIGDTLGGLHKSRGELIGVGEVFPDLHAAASAVEAVRVDTLAVSELRVGDDVRLSGIVELESTESSPKRVITSIAIPRVGSNTSLKVDRLISRTAVNKHLIDPHFSENVGGKTAIVDFETDDFFSVTPILKTSVSQEHFGVLESQPYLLVTIVLAPLVDRRSSGLIGASITSGQESSSSVDGVS